MNDRNDDDLSSTCDRVRNELASFLYGELPPDAHDSIARHLEGCVPCGEELAALRETRRLLSRWETPAASEDPRELARSIAARAGTAHRPPTDRTAVEPRALPSPRRARLVRWSAFVSGAAAAALFTLSLLSARMSVEGGRLQLDFGLPGTRPTSTAPVPSRDEMRAFVAQEVAAHTANLEQDQQTLLERYSQMSREDLQRELLRLSQAVDYAQAQMAQTWDTRLTALGREAARANLETRQAITEVAAHVTEPNR